MNVAYSDELVTLHHGDARHLARLHREGRAALMVVDPPWDDASAVAIPLPPSDARLVFTEPRRIGGSLEQHGPPTWLFTWDTLNSWQTGPQRPLSQTKLALFYGDFHAATRDSGTVSEPRQNRTANPSTPRRLDGEKVGPDIWRESLRWLHNPAKATDGAGQGADRFTERIGAAAFRHAKPVGWLRYLIAACSPGGLVLDPFAGSGTTLLAARALGRHAVGVEIDEGIVAVAVERLAGTYGQPPEQMRLDEREAA